MVNLTIGGGSFKGIAFIGALEYLYKKNYLTVIDNFYGCSIGSIIGILFIIGYKPTELLQIIIDLNLNDFWDPSIDNIEKKFSLLSDNFSKKLEEIFFEKEQNINITICEFNKKYNTNINIFSVNINTNNITNFNEDNFSSLEVLKAVRASYSIPFIFPPVIINSDYYIDGCLYCLNGDFHQNEKDKTNINLGYIIRLCYDYDKVVINNLNQYIETIFRCIMYNTINKKIYTKNTLEIKINNKYKNKVSFNDVSYSDRIELYYDGLKQASLFFEN